MLTQERVKELFNYEEGRLIRRICTSSRAKKHESAGCINGDGYNCIVIDGSTYKRSRLVYLYFNGYFPEQIVDHINRVRGDDRIENLREVSAICNIRNSSVAESNTSGVKGTHWNKIRGTWCSRIVINGKRVYLKSHVDKVEVVAHRLAAEQCINWSSCDSESSAAKFMKEYLEEVR